MQKLEPGSLEKNDIYIYIYIYRSERTITVERYDDDKKRNKKLTFKNNVPFKSCISKINNTFIGNTEDLDIVIPMYNLLEYSENYFRTSGSFWNYYRN